VRTLYCLEDFAHDRFVREIDGGYHRVEIYNATRQKLIYQESRESPVETHPFHCDVCGSPAIDLDDARTLKDRLKLLAKHMPQSLTAGTVEERLELLAGIKSLKQPGLIELLNSLSKVLIQAE